MPSSRAKSSSKSRPTKPQWKSSHPPPGPSAASSSPPTPPPLLPPLLRSSRTPRTNLFPSTLSSGLRFRNPLNPQGSPRPPAGSPAGGGPRNLSPSRHPIQIASAPRPLPASEHRSSESTSQGFAGRVPAGG